MHILRPVATYFHVKLLFNISGTLLGSKLSIYGNA